MNYKDYLQKFLEEDFSNRKLELFFFNKELDNAKYLSPIIEAINNTKIIENAFELRNISVDYARQRYVEEICESIDFYFYSNNHLEENLKYIAMKYRPISKNHYDPISLLDANLSDDIEITPEYQFNFDEFTIFLKKVNARLAKSNNNFFKSISLDGALINEIMLHKFEDLVLLPDLKDDKYWDFAGRKAIWQSKMFGNDLYNGEVLSDNDVYKNIVSIVEKENLDYSKKKQKQVINDLFNKYLISTSLTRSPLLLLHKRNDFDKLTNKENELSYLQRGFGYDGYEDYEKRKYSQKYLMKISKS